LKVVKYILRFFILHLESLIEDLVLGAIELTRQVMSHIQHITDLGFFELSVVARSGLIADVESLNDLIHFLKFKICLL
jgi:hypothetical protein